MIEITLYSDNDVVREYVAVRSQYVSGPTTLGACLDEVLDEAASEAKMTRPRAVKIEARDGVGLIDLDAVLEADRS